MGSSKGPRQRKRKGTAPAFDEAALAQLTEKIDKTLAGADTDQQPSPKRKRPNTTEDDRDAKRRQKNLVGTKEGQQDRPRKDQSHNTTKEVLLEEILALGGDEDDLELVANIDSDNEDGPGTKSASAPEKSLDKSFQDELAKFALSLGFQNIPREDDLESVSSEDPVDEEEDEEEEEEAEQSKQDDNQDQKQPQEIPTTVKSESTTAVQDAPREKQGKNKLVFEPRPDWHGLILESLPAFTPSADVRQYASAIASLKAYAEALLKEDAAKYSALQASSSTQKFMSTIMSSGTLSDKVSALTLSIQESPLHNQKAFESLIGLAGKKSRSQALAALGALVDLLGNGTVLPSNRRLRAFNMQPALLATLQDQVVLRWVQGQKLPANLTDSHLMMWAYEDWLKSAYFRIIQLLEIWSADQIEHSRMRALEFVFTLLRDKPEQEANLLRLLVNKLGDRERKIASRASYLLLQLLNVHPAMKSVVISTVEQEVLLKPSQSLRTRYYAIITLNQTILSTKEPAIANTLLRIYFEAFLSLLKTGSLGNLEALNPEEKSGGNNKKAKKGKQNHTEASANEQDTTQKLVSALLTGVNRAVPFTTADDETMENHLDTLFRITHSSNFNTSVQALMLIQQLAVTKHLAVDRFYRTLYESLLDPRLVTSSKQALYMNLLFRALKNDADVRRVKAFVKRLVQVLNLHQPSFACGVLYLISELENTFPDLHSLLTVPEDNEDDDVEAYKDVNDDAALQSSLFREDAPTSRHATGYDGRKRNPEHSNAHTSCLWELTPLLSHFHPSVQVYASNLLARQKGLPKPDLANHSLMHFLDKFVYRNPKVTETKRGSSIMQPVLATGGASQIVVSSKDGAKKQPFVNSASFWNLKPEQVSAEDVFFHEYFARIGKPGDMAKSKKASKEKSGPDGEEEEEEAEAEIWEALVNSRPEVEGDLDEDESDLGMDGYEDSDEEMDIGYLNMGGARNGSEGSDDDMPFEGIFDDSDDSEEAAAADESAGEEDASASKKKGRLSRKEMRGLPTFASADDYAEMLAGEDGLADD
ncbi:CBF/Mak21 family-domain-containing protein [Pseudoneurospora amorphoporcata]|uniref:CBF/Mak21 family-domain-containing protein n=1 Tax=Pseudoneurospora amorphoporcata TaxID=241081 RepID=A0AAN6NMD6_9PEZI|nr:CBF/Mak21 family-domain-containing protein [Pseudoneurospora amorphoporcata]